MFPFRFFVLYSRPQTWILYYDKEDKRVYTHIYIYILVFFYYFFLFLFDKKDIGFGIAIWPAEYKFKR